MKLPRATKGMFSALLLLLSLIFSGAASAGVLTEVVVNKSIILNLKNPAERLSLANPAIADLLLITPAQVQINGTAIGSTTLIVWEKGSAKPAFFDVNVVGDLSQLDPQIRGIAPNDSITAEYANDTLVLSGNIANEQTRLKVEQIAKAYSGKVVNHIKANEPQQVVLQVKVAQVDKSALKRLGISALVKGNTAEGFYNTVTAPDGNVSGISSAIGSISNLQSFQAGVSYFPSGIGAVLQALTTKNLAKILAEPNLLVKSGQKGNFLAGSKIPYNIVTSTGGTATTSIFFVDVGIKLNFAPIVMENGLISLKIDPAEVSSIQGTLAVNGYPIIDTREVRTDVELKDGESLVLAGLLQEDEILTMSKIPILGDIPILGALFRSTQKDLREKELVFFITPTVIKPIAPGTKVEMPTDKAPTPEQEKELQWMPMGE